jgi:hypothetical protein
MVKRLTTALLGSSAIAALLSGLASPAQADATWTLGCVGGGASVGCVVTRHHGVVHPNIRRVPSPVSEQETAEIKARDKAWETLCRPEIRQDRFGVPRYIYAAPGCEYGRVE